MATVTVNATTPESKRPTQSLPRARGQRRGTGGNGTGRTWLISSAAKSGVSSAWVHPRFVRANVAGCKIANSERAMYPSFALTFRKGDD